MIVCLYFYLVGSRSSAWGSGRHISGKGNLGMRVVYDLVLKPVPNLGLQTLVVMCVSVRVFRDEYSSKRSVGERLWTSLWFWCLYRICVCTVSRRYTGNRGVFFISQETVRDVMCRHSAETAWGKPCLDIRSKNTCVPLLNGGRCFQRSW